MVKDVCLQAKGPGFQSRRKQMCNASREYFGSGPTDILLFLPCEHSFLATHYCCWWDLFWRQACRRKFVFRDKCSCRRKRLSATSVFPLWPLTFSVTDLVTGLGHVAEEYRRQNPFFGWLFWMWPKVFFLVVSLSRLVQWHGLSYKHNPSQSLKHNKWELLIN